MMGEESEFERGQRVQREKQTQADVHALTDRMTRVEVEQRKLSTAFGEFVTRADAATQAARSAAENALSTRTFMLGVLALILTAVALVLGHA